tara:strand:- start:54378 stop:54908 length:531 start_codon:yes stop_codon:yes gene_type:complete
MKKIFSLLVAMGLSGCASLPDQDVDSLKTPSGKGALAVLTTFSDWSGKQPCYRYSLEMFDKIDESKKVLNFYPDADKKYVLFDDIEKGSYVIKAIRCFPRTGYVFDGNKTYIESKVLSELVIKANMLTLSKDAFSGVVYDDGSFSVSFSRSAQTREFLKQIISEEDKVGWPFYTHE